MQSFEPSPAGGIASEHREQFCRGIQQFNSGHFFEAHETWEEIWLATPEPNRTFLQGIIQIAAAFHHYRRGNREGTRLLLEAGVRRLAQCPAAHFGIALDPLRSSAAEWAAALADGRDPGTTRVPTIQGASNG